MRAGRSGALIRNESRRRGGVLLDPIPPTSETIPARLRSVLLLAGQVGRNSFADAIGRPLLDLPVDPERTVLDVWLDGFERLARSLDLPRLTVRVAIHKGGLAPKSQDRIKRSRVVVEVVPDPGEYRGTAGVARDLTRQYASGDWVVVAAANQVLREPLEDVFRALAERGESVSIVETFGSEVAGMFLLRCDRLIGVPEVGFVDLKEQALPSSRGHARLGASRRPAGSALPLRTLEEYVRALRAVHGTQLPPATGVGASGPFAETWIPAFSIVEPGASVASGAVLQDSVILAGGRVEEGAAVARSVVCAGGVVRRGECVVEATVSQG